MPKWRKNDGDGDGDGGEGIDACELSRNRKVVVKMWQKRIFVDIREYYSKEGKQLPGKKGISLSLEQWELLRDHIHEVDKAIT